MELSIRELVILCVAARNSISEYCGFSPTQALFPGYVPSDWSRLERPMTPEEKFQDEGYKRILAQRAIQNAIYEERIRLGMRGKGPEVDKHSIEVGQQIEVFVKSKKKDAEGGTGWIDILTPDGQNISSKGGDDDDEEEAQE